MTETGILWRCLDCNYTTKFKPVMFQHVESKHTFSSGYSCQFCAKFCPSRNALRCHVSRQHKSNQQLHFLPLAAVEQKMVKHQTDQGVLWQCVDCGYQTKFKPVMFEHVESKHIESAGYTCPHCNKFCRTRNALRSHVSRQHPEHSTKTKRY